MSPDTFGALVLIAGALIISTICLAIHYGVTMFRSILAAILATVAILAGVTVADAQAPSSRPAWQSTPCAQEDSSDCYWDAGESGNGAGHSFYAVTVNHGKRVCVLYWQKSYARKRNHCEANPYAK